MRFEAIRHLEAGAEVYFEIDLSGDGHTDLSLRIPAVDWRSVRFDLERPGVEFSGDMEFLDDVPVVRFMWRYAGSAPAVVAQMELEKGGACSSVSHSL